MGKIFKALKKAENQRLVEREPQIEKNSKSLQQQQNYLKDKTNTSQKPIANLKSNLSSTKEGKVSQEYQDRLHGSISGKETKSRENKKVLNPEIKNNNADRSIRQKSKVAVNENCNSVSADTNYIHSSENENESILNNSEDNSNYYKTRNLEESSKPSEQTETRQVLLNSQDFNPKPRRKDVLVRYSKTKVQINDPVMLKNNRVLSMFEDLETTNQFKFLRTQVLKRLKDIGGNSILVTSANPCEGKTFTSINLGVSIAKEFDRTVLIIDADIRRPLQKHTDFSTEFFSLKVEKGLTDYLKGNADIEDILINPGIDKLTLIPAGKLVDNSPELLNSVKMEEMMKDIRSRYSSDRLIIVDGPAILHFPDAMILSKYVDGVLAVIESEKTSNEQLKKMVNNLAESTIIGTVLNKKKS